MIPHLFPLTGIWQVTPVNFIISIRVPTSTVRDRALGGVWSSVLFTVLWVVQVKCIAGVVKTWRPVIMWNINKNCVLGSRRTLDFHSLFWSLNLKSKCTEFRVDSPSYQIMIWHWWLNLKSTHHRDEGIFKPCHKIHRWQPATFELNYTKI